MLSKIGAGLGIQSYQPKLAAFEQGKEYLEEGRTYYKKQAYEPAKKRFDKAKEAFKKAVFNAVDIEDKQKSEALLGQSYLERGDAFRGLKRIKEARSSYEKARPYQTNALVEERLRLLLSVEPQAQSKAHAQHLNQLTHQFALTALSAVNPSIAAVASLCFKQDPSPTVYEFDRSAAIDDLHNTRHLAYCLQEAGLLEERKKTLKNIADGVLEAFSKKHIKRLDLIQEVIPLAMIEDSEIHQALISLTVNELDLKHNVLLHRKLARGLAVMIRLCPSSLQNQEGLSSGDLTRILNIFKERLEIAHRERNEVELQSLLQAVTQLLDGMVQRGVGGIDRTRLQEPLNVILKELSEAQGMLGWQAGYARQALAHISNNESKLHEIWRHTFNALGVLTYFSGGVIKAVNGDIEPDKFYDALAKFFEVKGSIEQSHMRRSNWYLALRVADFLLETNQLIKFETFVESNQCSADPNFLQGICHRLEQIACTHPDERIRQGAVGFLSKLSRFHGQPERLSEVAQSARNALDRIESGHHAEVAPVWDLSWSQTGEGTLLKEALLKLKEAHLREAQRTQLQPDREPLAILGDDIEKMRRNYLSGLQNDETVKDALILYVAPEGKAVGSGESGERFDLNSKLNAFLDSDKKVLLLLGEAGSGKSTFNRYLARDLWEKYEQADRKEDKRIPVFIPLTTLEDPNKNLLTEYFTEEGFSKEQIQQLRQNRRFIFILDGYDEIKHRQRAFYTDNKLDKWDAKVIISSRPEYLGPVYQSKFYPSGQARVFEEWELAPFSEDAIEDYIERHVRHAQDPEWNVAQYQSALAHPDLQALIGNPFLLKIVLEVLPSLDSEEESSNRSPYTRTALYEQFAQNWFARSQSRLQGIQLTQEEQKTFNRLAEEDFIQHGIHFSQEFALALYDRQVLIATYLPSAPGQAQEWRNFLGNDDEKRRLLRFNAPLSRQGDQYSFIHKSLRDYFVARALWEELAVDGEIDAFSRFNRLNIVNDPAILQFLAERVGQEPQLETRLLNVVEQSKGEEGAQFARGAANALTLLVKSGVQLINENFNGIRVREADLSYGVFDHTQFEGADLRKVNWRGAWLRGINLNEADLEGVELGERPTLNVRSLVEACCYSPDGHWLAVAEDRGVIQLYETHSMRRIRTYKGHGQKVTSVAFSPNSHWLASGSYDSTVKLWSVNVLGSCRPAYTFEGHGEEVTSVAFSSNGHWLVSGSDDRTVKLWSVLDPRRPAHTYEGHEMSVNSVTFSPDGLWIASGSSDCTAKLWHALYVDEPAYTYVGHEDEVVSVAFSPKGEWLASGSYDNTVKLWSTLGTRELVHTYAGHESLVMSVAFSPDDHWLVTGSMDYTVKLWDVLGVRRLVHTYAGHEETVNSVAFSPDSQWVASGSDDWTVKLWSVLSTHEFGHITDAGHKGAVNSIVFSRDGDWLASGSGDKTVKLWGVLDARGLRHVATARHERVVNSVAFSPNGDWLASGSSDETVALLSLVPGAQELTDTYLEHEKEVTSVAFSPNGDLLASGSWDNTVKLWSFLSGTWSFVSTFKHDSWVRAIAFSPNGAWLASGSDDNTVKLWCVLSGKLEHTYIGHESLVMSVAFSPNGRWIASGSNDKSVKLWGGSSPRKLVRTYSGHWQGVNNIAFSPDSDWLASGSDDSTVRVWSVQKGDCQAVIRGFIGPVNTVNWKIMPDGSFMLATGGLDTSIRFWRILRDGFGEIDQVLLEWASEQRTLVASDALIGVARNLSSENEALLIERGAEVFFEEDSDGDDFTESDTN